MRASETIRHIQIIASLGLAPRVAVPLIVDAMHDLIPVNQIPFFWADSDGTITDFYGPDVMPSTLESAMTLNRYNTPDDVPTMDRLLNSARLINNTALLQQLAGWSNSAFLNDMLRGNNGENSMDFQLRDASGIRGAFAISRGLQDRAMSADEVRRVAALVPHILHAMNAQAGPESHETVASREIAHIISNIAGEVISCSANAANMILQLYDMPLGHAVRFSDFLDRLPPAAMLAVQRLRLIQNGETANPASIDLPTRWGLFRVSAVPMQAKPETISEMVIVTIQPLIDKRVKWAQNLVGTDLTPAERRVAMRMAGAGDGDAIAHDLGIETSSYRQYAKRIYTALRVEGRMGVKAFLDR